MHKYFSSIRGVQVLYENRNRIIFSCIVQQNRTEELRFFTHTLNAIKSDKNRTQQNENIIIKTEINSINTEKKLCLRKNSKEKFH